MMNRESHLIQKAMDKSLAVGRVLAIVFAVAAGFFAVLAVVLGFSLVMGAQEAAGRGGVVVATVSALVEDAVMIASFVLCSLLARDVSKGRTPFSATQINRTRAIAWILVGYFVFCLVWGPLASSSLFVAGPLSLEVVSPTSALSPAAADIHVNFGVLLAACAFFLFSYILNYGRTLQRLSDETV